MANNSGRSGERRLVDLGVYPEVEVYEPPKCPPADEHTYDAELPGGQRLVHRLRIYRGKIVDFALEQLIQVDGGNWVEVARIDCCRSTVHRHQFDQAGLDIYDHRVIVQIPKNGWDVVNEAFLEAHGRILAEADENVRRWKGNG